jgi:hypothetical protein
MSIAWCLVATTVVISTIPWFVPSTWSSSSNGPMRDLAIRQAISVLRPRIPSTPYGSTSSCFLAGTIFRDSFLQFDHPFVGRSQGRQDRGFGLVHGEVDVVLHVVVAGLFRVDSIQVLAGD